jgi:hypothetical protein
MRTRKRGELAGASEAASPGAGASIQQLAFQGGPVVSSPELVSLFWGRFTPDELSGMVRWLQNYTAYLSGVGAPVGHEPVCEQYGVAGASVGVVYHDPVVPAFPVGWKEVGDEIARLQGLSLLPPASPQRIFLIFSKGLFPGHATVGGWCGDHGGGSGVPIALIPFPENDADGAMCGNNDPVKSWQNVTSHEILEAATDPTVAGGWLAGGPQSEGGDLCEWIDAGLNFGGAQKFADNIQQACSTWTIVEAARFSIARSGPFLYDVVHRGTDGAIYQKWFDGTNWKPSTSKWTKIGGKDFQLIGAPQIVSRLPDIVDLFVRNNDGIIYHTWWGHPSAGAEINWESMGGRMAGNPAVISTGASFLNVFARGLDGALHDKFWDGAVWTPGVLTDWRSLGGQCAGNPSCCSPRPDQIDVFIRSLNLSIQHRTLRWNGSAWLPTGKWEDLGGAFIGNPTCVVSERFTIDIFGRGLDNAIYHRHWDGQAWDAGWTSISDIATAGDVGAASWSIGRIDLFARSKDKGTVQHKWFDGANWMPSLTAWHDIGGDTVGSPLVLSLNANDLEILVQDQGGNLLHKSWDGAWIPPNPKWDDLHGTMS